MRIFVIAAACLALAATAWAQPPQTVNTATLSAQRVQVCGGDFVDTYGYGGAGASGLDVEYDCPHGNPAATFAMRTRNVSGCSGCAPAGAFFWNFNDETSNTVPGTWAIYNEARSYPGVTTPTNVRETDITNLSTITKATDPYVNAYNMGLNLTVGDYIQSGGGCIASAPCYNPVSGAPGLAASDASVAIAIGDNGAKFENGIQFNYNALTGNDGTTDGQYGIAILMPRNDAVQWDYCNNSTTYPTSCGAYQMGASIESTVKSATSFQKLVFDNANCMELLNAASSILFNVACGVNYTNGVKVLPGRAGTASTIAAISASDTNVHLSLIGQGTGLALLGGSCSATGATPQRCNAQRGQVQTNTLTTAAMTDATFVINDTFAAVNLSVFCSSGGYGGTMVTNGVPVITQCIVGAGTITVHITNVGSNALNGIETINFMVE